MNVKEREKLSVSYFMIIILVFQTSDGKRMYGNKILYSVNSGFFEGLLGILKILKKIIYDEI